MRLKGMILQLTQNCNLRCKYCVYSGGYYNRKHNNKRMDWETAKKALEFFIKHSVERPEKTISFYGGEPLLEFPLMKKCILWIEETYKEQSVSFNFTTNATLLNEEIIKFLDEHNIMLLISLDGPEQIHDQFRVFSDGGKGSFNAVMRTVRLLKEQFPEYYKNKVAFNTVFAASKFACVEQFVSGETIFRDSSFLSSVVNDVNKKEKNEITEEFTVEANYTLFLGLLYRLGRIGKVKQLKLLESVIVEMGKIDKSVPKRLELPDKWHHGGPCIPGVMRLFVDVDGNFYPCEKVAETNDNVRIGNLDSGFDYEKMVDILNIENKTKENCQKCWAYQDCRLCIACFDSEFDEEKITAKCISARSQVETIYKDYCLLRELKHEWCSRKE